MDHVTQTTPVMGGLSG